MRVAVVAAWVAVVAGSFGQDAATNNPAVAPAPRAEAWWMEKHQQFVVQAIKGGIDVLFVGDSITAGWAGAGKAAWAKHFEPLKAANFGISGDRTEHLLWRLRGGELEGVQPKLVVLMIGTNNLKGGQVRQPPEQVAEGVAAVVKEIRTHVPGAKILLHGILPRQPGYDWIAAAVADVNTRLAALADGEKVVFLDFGAKFLDAQGKLNANLMPDLLHPNARGYEAWAEATIETVRSLAGVGAKS
jgi:lysophospholipase L1-like esterase